MIEFDFLSQKMHKSILTLRKLPRPHEKLHDEHSQ